MFDVEYVGGPLHHVVVHDVTWEDLIEPFEFGEVPAHAHAMLTLGLKGECPLYELDAIVLGSSRPRYLYKYIPFREVGHE